MSDPKHVSGLLNELHDRKIINLETSVRSLLEPGGLRNVSPGSEVASAVIAWDGYALVIATKEASLVEVSAAAKAIREVATRGGGE
jgi:hypothetical protein